MYDFSSTLADVLAQHIKAHAPTKMEEIQEIYEQFIGKNERFRIGERYYKNESDILDEKIHTYIDGVKVVDKEATNERIPSGMHKILVDQKVAYLSGEPMTFGSKTDNKQQLELLEEIIGEKWEDTFVELLLNASNKGIEWLRPYINEQGEFDYVVASAEQVIPLYDMRYGNLVGVIYFYQVSDTQVKLELWTANDVTYYEIIDDKMYLDAEQATNPSHHFHTVDGTSGYSWGKVPFIKFANNKWELGDLHFNKRAIDAYEKLVSKTQNTVIDIQELIFELKGYDGEDLSEFHDNLRRYKAIAVDEDGGVKTLTATVPTDAYKTQSEVLRKTIITAGQGVDPSPDVIGTAPSGVALDHLYSLLDMKASMLERKFTLALREFMYFIDVYCDLAKVGDFEYRDVTFTFNKTLITNEAEIVQMARDSEGIISRTTILENHPWVQDVAQEQNRLEDDEKMYGRDLPPLMEQDEVDEPT